MEYFNLLFDNISLAFNKIKHFSINNIIDLIKNKSSLFFDSRYGSKQILIKNKICENTKNIKQNNKYYGYKNFNNFNKNFNYKCDCVNNCDIKCNCDWGWFVTLDV